MEQLGILIKAACGIMDTCLSMLFWEAGYSLGALILIPLLFTPFGLGGFAAAALSIIVCALTAGLGIAIWNFIRYTMECYFKGETFYLKDAAKLCIFGFIIGANFVICTFLLFIPGGKKIVETLLDVTVSVVTGLFACIISFLRERTTSNMKDLRKLNTKVTASTAPAPVVGNQQISEPDNTNAGNTSEQKKPLKKKETGVLDGTPSLANSISKEQDTTTPAMITEVLTTRMIANQQVSKPDNTNAGNTSKQEKTLVTNKTEGNNTPSCFGFVSQFFKRILSSEPKQGYKEKQDQGVLHRESKSTLTLV
jgi:hypothetical protein